MKIDYSNLRNICESRGITMKEAAFMCDVKYSTFRAIVVYSHNPNTDTIAKICYGLDIRPSNFINFDFEYERVGKLYGAGKEKVKPCALTYDPLRELFIHQLLNNKKPSTDVELYKLLGNYSPIDKDTQKKVISTALNSRGIDYNSDIVKKRTGLSTALRTSIENDRPVKMWIIYDICKIMQCSVDNVLYFKCA